MAENRNTDPENSPAEKFRRAVKEGDIDLLEHLLLQEEDDAFDDQLRAAWNEPVPPVAANDLEEAFHSFEGRIRPRRRTMIPSFLRRAAAVAAVVAIAVLWWQGRREEVRIVETEWAECSTTYGQTRQLTLADGTQLWLNAGSRVLYPTDFHGRERRVYISGEVYLDVVKDPARPFCVSADGTEIRVLGTQFNVKAYLGEKEITTTLVSGSIEMRLPGAEEIYRLTPGKTLQYDRTSGDIALYTTPEYNYPAWFRGEFTFHNETLEAIASELERKFDVRIVIRNPELTDIRFFAGFVNNESVDEILAALNLQKQFRIVRRGKVIDIY